MPIREIILDTETTGLNPYEGHRIIEIGAIVMVNKVLTGEKFHFYLNPERDVPMDSYKIHGISRDFLQDKPLFKDIVHDFLDFIKNGSLVIHNAPFDIKFINYELGLLNLPPLELADVIDTLLIAKKAFPGAKISLDALCQRFKIDRSARRFHGAIKDADLLAQVYVELSGGRQESFILIDEKAKKHADRENNNFPVKGNKIIIYPTEDELQKHEIFLEKILIIN